VTGRPLADLAIYVAGVLVALGTIYRYVVPALRALWRLIEGTSRLVEDFRQTGGFAGLHAEVAEVKVLAEQSRHELHPNGGDSMRDGVDRIETVTEGLARTTEELRGHAAANSEGIADLRDQTNDIARRVTDLDEKADAQEQRITDHRRRNEETVKRIEEYLTGERQDLLIAKQGLEASVTELLQVDDPSSRDDS
jgi:chromosome segregation ATPase